MLYALDVLASAPSISAVDHRGMSLLSEREIEVVACLAEGLTNREIGERLGLSRHTVKNYLFRIFDKIGVSSRTELLHLTLRQPAQVHDSLRQKDKDDISEFEMCFKAAENGSPEARVKLAERFCNEQGALRDYVAAYMWYLLSEHSIANLRQRAHSAKAQLANLMKSEEILEAQERAREFLKEPEAGSSSFSATGIVLQKESAKFSVA
jgi:DNA-binding CsgD family transcriptional regulator